MTLDLPLTMQQVEKAMKQAQQTAEHIDLEVGAMLRLSAGKLRQASKRSPGKWSDTTEALRKMKAELRDFDSRTGTWKDKR